MSYARYINTNYMLLKYASLFVNGSNRLIDYIILEISLNVRCHKVSVSFPDPRSDHGGSPTVL